MPAAGVLVHGLRYSAPILIRPYPRLHVLTVNAETLVLQKVPQPSAARNGYFQCSSSRRRISQRSASETGTIS